MNHLYLRYSSLALSSTAFLCLISNSAQATCIENPAGVYECSGAESGLRSISQGGNLDVTTTSSYSNADGLSIENNNTGTGLKYTHNAGASVSSSSYAIVLQNNGTGSSFIESSGSVSSDTEIGVAVINGSNATDLTVHQNAGVINGYKNGIYTLNTGTGSTTVKTQGIINASVSPVGAGLVVENQTTAKDITITQEGGSIHGKKFGIFLQNSGTGSININLAGNVSAGTFNSNDDAVALEVIGGFNTTDFNFTQAAGSTIQSTKEAVRLNPEGTGYSTVEIAGNIYSSQNSTIDPLTPGLTLVTADNSKGASLVQKSGSSVIGSGVGIVVVNGGGSANLDISGDVRATDGNGFGVSVLNKDTATTKDLIIHQRAGSIEGGRYGILIANRGSGVSRLTSASSIAGGTAAVTINVTNAGQVDIINTSTGNLRNLSGSSSDTAIIDNSPTSWVNIDNAGKIAGTVQFANNQNNSFINQNNGVWNTAGGTNEFGTGFNTLVNDGTVIAANAGASAPVVTTFNGLTRFTNNATGVLAMGNGIAGDRTVISGDYIGNGGMVTLDTMLGDDSAVTDVLTIQGDASGSAKLVVANAGGAGGLTVEGIKVINVVGNSAANGFALVGDYIHQGEPAKVGGAYAYKLYQHGISTPGDGDWYLRSTALTPDDRTRPDPNPNPSPNNPIVPKKPLYQAGVPTYEAYPQTLLNLNRLPTLRQRLGNDQQLYIRAFDDVKNEPGKKDLRLWGRIEGEHGEYKPNTSTSSTHYRQNIYRIQMGLDTSLLENTNGELFGGLNMQYSHGNSNTLSVHGDGTIKTDGYGLGATLTWYGDSGVYLDAQARVTWYSSDLSSTLANRNLVKDNDGFGYGLSLEGGKRYKLSTPGWSVTPQAQLSYSEVYFSSFTDPFGARVELSRGASLLGRVGVALDYDNEWKNASGNKNLTNVYGVANLEYEFLDGTKVNVANTGFINRNERLGASLGLGVSNNWRNGNYTYTAYAEGSVKTSLQNFGDTLSVMAHVGLRIQW